MGEFLERFDRIDLVRVDGDIGTLCQRHLPPIDRKVRGNHPRAHLHGQHGGGEAHRTLAEDGDSLVAFQVGAFQRAMAVPVPQETAAYAGNERPSGIVTMECVGAQKYFACQPWPP